MFAVQSRLPMPRPVPARSRSVRRPFHPHCTSSYKFPHDVRDRLTTALAPYRNREAAFALAVFLARFWSIPDHQRRDRMPAAHIPGTFHIDRCALADRPDLGLTEARIRGAIRVLEEIGFLERALGSGSKYRATEEGLRRKPVLFVFGSEYASLFSAANRRSAAARGGHSGGRRPITLSDAPRLSPGFPVAPPLKSPKSTSVAFPHLHSGELKQSGLPPTAFEPDSPLEAALDRLKRAIGTADGG